MLTRKLTSQRISIYMM